MTRVVGPVVLAGSLRAAPQPDLVAAGALRLRPWRPDAPGDIEAVLAAFADPEIQRWGVRDIGDAAQASAWMSGWATGWDAETDACWAVVRDGVVVGRVALRRVDLEAGQAELTYWVLPGARGRGVASAAAAEVARWAFEGVGLHRIELWHSVLNEGSCRVARRLGLPLERTLRDGMLHVDGWHDLHLHAAVSHRRPPLPVT